MSINNERNMRHLWWALLVAVVGLALPASAEMDLPLPKENSGLAGPYETMLGRRPVKIYAFETTLSPDALREFYLKMLPKHGWQVQSPPWMAKWGQGLAQAEQSIAQAEAGALEKLDSLRKERPDEMKEVDDQQVLSQVRSQLQPVMSRMNEARQMMQHTLYAFREDEYALINMTPRLASTGVFINRWQGDLFNPQKPGGQQGQGASGGRSGLSPNICCTGESVPVEARKLPLSIPDYPEAKMIAAGAPARSSMVSAVYISHDPLESIEAFYRERMAYNGWTEGKPREDTQSRLQQRVADLTGSPEKVSALKAKTAHLSFKNDEGMCVIAIAETPAAHSLLPGFPAAATEAQAASPEQEPVSNTAILVNFIGHDALKRGATKHAAPRLPQ